MNNIQANTTLTARSVCDHDCIFSLEVINRTAKTATIKYMGEVKRTKVHTDSDGREFLKPDNYSMCPVFRAA